MRNDEEKKLKNNVFEELHEYLEAAGYFKASEKERARIWEKIAKMWNLKDKNA